MTSLKLNEDDFVNQVTLLAADLYTSKIMSKAKSMAGHPPDGMDKNEVAKSETLAKKELNKPHVKKIICASLKSTRGDIRDIAKIVAAALLPLSLSGTIALPITPLAFAAAAVIVFDAGISAFCAECS